MTALRGTDVLVKRGNGADPEVFTTVGAIRNATVNFNGASIDTTTRDNVDANGEIWRDRITGVKDITVEGEGLGKAIEPIQSLVEDYLEGNLVNYELTIPYVGVFVVPMLVVNGVFTGQYDDAFGFSASLESAGAPAYTAAT